MKVVHYSVAKLTIHLGNSLRVRLETLLPHLLYEYGQQGWELVQWDIIPQNLTSSDTNDTTTILVTFKKVST